VVGTVGGGVAAGTGAEGGAGRDDDEGIGVVVVGVAVDVVVGVLGTGAITYATGCRVAVGVIAGAGAIVMAGGGVIVAALDDGAVVRPIPDATPRRITTQPTRSAATSRSRVNPRDVAGAVDAMR